MMQRICPVCDQVMKHAHYCSACRSWVKEPVYMNVTYYLNERHPKNEAHCSYHNGAEEPETHAHSAKKAQKAKTAGVWESKAGAKPGARSDTRTFPAKTKTRDWNQQAKSKTSADPWEQAEKPKAGKSARKSNPKPKLLLLYIAIIIIIWIAKLIGGLGSMLFGMFRSGGLDDLTQIVQEADDGAARELTDEEAIAYGGPCTDENHFSVTMDALEQPFQELLDAGAVSVESQTVYSYNMLYPDDTTWFSTSEIYYMDSDQFGVNAQIEFDSDTATRELHQIYLEMPDRGALADLTKQVLLMLNDHGAWTAKQEDPLAAEKLDYLYNELLDHEKDGEEHSWQGAGLYLDSESTGYGNCSIYIYPNTDETDFSTGSEAF